MKRTLAALGISRGSYYRWLKEEAWSKERSELRPVQAFEALPEERAAVLAYARQHPEIRHRELAWRMIDEEVAFLSSSTVYRILREANLMCRQRGRKKRYREEIEKATRPDERWGTDLMYVTVSGVNYFYLAFIDEYSRYIVHWELLSNMEGHSVSLGGQKALETLPRTEHGELLARPEIRSDNGSGFISKEFHGVLEHYGLTHVKIRPHCPEENGIMERSNRTVREALEEAEPASRYEAEAAVGPDHSLVQPRAAAQQLGIPATDRLLPGRPEIAARGPAEETGRRSSSSPREEPGATTTNLAHREMTNLLQTFDLGMSHCR